MITTILLTILFSLVQIGFANIFTVGYAVVLPLLSLIVLLNYLELPKQGWVAAALGGIMLDIFSSLKFGNFLFIYLVISFASNLFLGTPDHSVRASRALLLVGVVSIAFQWFILSRNNLDFPIIVWPLILTGLLNATFFYLALKLTNKFLEHE